MKLNEVEILVDQTNFVQRYSLANLKQIELQTTKKT